MLAARAASIRWDGMGWDGMGWDGTRAEFRDPVKPKVVRGGVSAAIVPSAFRAIDFAPPPAFLGSLSFPRYVIAVDFVFRNQPPVLVPGISFCGVS